MGSVRIMALMVACSILGLSACTPTVQVQAPKKPIVVNMNVKIKHKLKVKIEKDVDDAINENPDIF